jgi:hypothetical protein
MSFGDCRAIRSAVAGRFKISRFQDRHEVEHDSAMVCRSPKAQIDFFKFSRSSITTSQFGNSGATIEKAFQDFKIEALSTVSLVGIKRPSIVRTI